MSDKLRVKIDELLRPFPEAQRFVQLYTEYAHAIDDIIDEKLTDPEFILRTFDLAAEVYSCKFYRDNVHILRSIDFMSNNTYLDSVLWERSDESFKKVAAGTLRHAGLDLFLATVSICCGREKMRSISMEMREHTFICHLDAEGNNV